MELSAAATRILAGLLEARTGQQLSTGRQWRLDTALVPIMRARGIESVDLLVAALVGGRDARLADAVIEALLNNETSFFRDHGPFQQLMGPVLSRLHSARAGARRLRVWSVGCSTGQEPYSLAMGLAEQADLWRGWTIDIQATDVSRSATARAREGLYTQFEVQRGLPVRQLLRWFDREGEQWRLVQALREKVRFHVHSLTEPMPLPGMFDVILCRNVLLYFPPPMRRAVLDRLGRAIAPDGVLMLGAGETIIDQTERFEPDPAARGFYRLRETPRPIQLAAIPGFA
ncbi:CheR family methyltransferase [Flavisphingomonas formosensis]|uniref:CheR family methyltransferase n=1 Tax=Flavisphingomonas formosensis TaxID=861534 RepID=UPI0012F9A901|nr:CheR family methyltransferase [Sphingomonas formosensis]